MEIDLCTVWKCVFSLLYLKKGGIAFFTMCVGVSDLHKRPLCKTHRCDTWRLGPHLSRVGYTMEYYAFKIWQLSVMTQFLRVLISNGSLSLQHYTVLWRGVSNI